MVARIVSPAKALRTLRKTDALLTRQFAAFNQADAETLRDGPEGWSVLQIACHLRDFEVIWSQRVALMLAEDNPTFPDFDYQAAVNVNRYAEQDFATVCVKLTAQRAALIAQLEGLSDEHWLRPGLHPAQGPGTILDVAVNAGLHDLDHLEQLSRCG
ncbi:MAG: DinB family protein [Oscillochloridaceae bacterium umkhey_bin13]